MFDTWSKNNEQKCWADLQCEASSWFVFLLIFFLDIHTTSNNNKRFFCFSHDALWQGAGNTDKEKHLKPTSHTNPSSAQPQNEIKKKKKYRKYGHVIYTAFTLDLNYKHTSIFQLHISPTYSVPLDRYSLLLKT